MNNKKILVITPTYNEVENIEEFVSLVLKKSVSLLIVDDNSPDGTGKVITELKKQFNNLYSIHRVGRLGLGSAYKEGFQWAINNKFQYVIEMDADFSHRLVDLDELIKNAGESDLILGSRYIPGGGSIGWDRKRKLLSASANLITRLIIGTQTKDITSGFRLYTSSSLNNVDYKSVSSDGYAFQIEMFYLYFIADKKILEIPIQFEERRLGKSKMNNKIIIEALLLLQKLLLKRLNF
ncbi:polyprenol monophosphomannose synthase [Acidimicrobiia bacterium]|nr:polyprenol monophosphomannose synthase [Acidimicrobiia bacterium]